MLKMEIKFEYTRLNKEKLTYFSWFISVKVGNFFRKFGAQLRKKVKKIEAQAK